MRGLFLQIISGILALLLAKEFISGVEFEGKIQFLILAGAILGLLNFFLKPILKFITLPLLLLSFGLFSFILNMAIIWLVEIIFPTITTEAELVFQGIAPLFWTTLLVWGVSILVSIFLPKFSKTIKG